MTVTVSFDVGNDDFPLGGVFREEGATRIEFENVVPRGEAAFPYAWVDAGSYERVRAALERRRSGGSNSSNRSSVERSFVSSGSRRPTG